MGIGPKAAKRLVNPWRKRRPNDVNEFTPTYRRVRTARPALNVKSLSTAKMADVIEDIAMECSDNEEILPKTNSELAELKKENGNQLYKIKQYKSALPLYTEAIDLCPKTASYYGNRSACYLMLNKYREALEDARSAIHLDPTFTKGYIRVLKCGIALGDLTTAEGALTKINENVINTTVAAETRQLEILKQYEGEALKAAEKMDYRKIVYCMDRCLDQSPTCARYKITKAESLVFLGRYDEAQEIANGVLHLDKGNADAIFVRGVCLYYDDNINSAFNHFIQVLRLAPDHNKAKDIYKRAKMLKKMKEDGNEAYKTGKHSEAHALYSEALTIDPMNKKTNAKLYFNRALVLTKLGKNADAISDCTNALTLDEKYLKALLRRAKCYMDLGDYEEAVRDYEQACKMEKNRENKRLLQDAKFALKKSKRKDYYKILGVEKNASEDEIKKAYRKRALVHHPDRHASATEAEKKEQEKKFKELGEAYSVLSDQKKKARYDSGQDLDDYADGAGMHDFDAQQVFQTFFTSRDFNFGGAQGGGGGGGFPGGFSFQFG